MMEGVTPEHLQQYVTGLINEIENPTKEHVKAASLTEMHLVAARVFDSGKKADYANALEGPVARLMSLHRVENPETRSRIADIVMLLSPKRFDDLRQQEPTRDGNRELLQTHFGLRSPRPNPSRYLTHGQPT